MFSRIMQGRHGQFLTGKALLGALPVVAALLCNYDPTNFFHELFVAFFLRAVKC